MTFTSQTQTMSAPGQTQTTRQAFGQPTRPAQPASRFNALVNHERQVQSRAIADNEPERFPSEWMNGNEKYQAKLDDQTKQEPLTVLFRENESITGLVEADGGIYIEPKIWKDHVHFQQGIEITQRTGNVKLLKYVAKTLNDPDHYIKNRKRIQNGKVQYSSRIAFGWTTEAAQRMLAHWEKHPPIHMTKTWNYKVSVYLRKACTRSKTSHIEALASTLNVTIEDLQQQNIGESDAQVATIYARYQRYGIDDSPNATSKEEHYEKLGVTPIEITNGEILGQKLVAQLKAEFDQQIRDGQKHLTMDRLIGFHLGDGSFTVTNELTKPTGRGRGLIGRFSWVLTDTIKNQHVFRMWQTFLEHKAICVHYYDDLHSNSARLKVTGKSCIRLVELFRNSNFPGEKQKQYKQFSKALAIYHGTNLTVTPEHMAEYVKACHAINPQTAELRKNSLEQDQMHLDQHFKALQDVEYFQ